MKKTPYILSITFLMAALLFVQSASATTLTFDVEDENVYVGPAEAIKDSYGYRVTDPNRVNGNYLEGNGWTHNITVTYLPKGQGGLLTAGGGGIVEVEVAVPNGDFETGTPFSPGAMPPWDWGHNTTYGYENFFQENRYGSTAPPSEETWPSAGPYHCAAFYQGGWAYNDLSHIILPSTTYTASFDLRGTNETNPTGWVGLQIYAGEEHEMFIAQDSNDAPGADWDTVTFDFNTAVHPDAVGEILSLRLVQQDGHTGGLYHYVYIDNVRMTYPVDFSDWDKVAQLPYVPSEQESWDIILTPDRGYAVDLNSFELDPLGVAGGNQSGNWTVFQDDENGAVIDSGSWTNLIVNSTENVDMSSVGGSYAGPVLLRLTITGGNAGELAVDNINYDQVKLDCDKGYEMAWDLVPDCSIDLLDYARFALDWLECNDPLNVNCGETWPQ